MKERAHRLYSSSPASNIVGKVQGVAGFPTMQDVGLLEPTRNRAGEVNNKSGWVPKFHNENNIFKFTLTYIHTQNL